MWPMIAEPDLHVDVAALRLQLRNHSLSLAASRYEIDTQVCPLGTCPAQCSYYPAGHLSFEEAE